MRKCPYCDSFGKLKIHVHGRPYGRCSACDLIYQDHPATSEEVLATYRDEYFNTCGIDQVGGSRDILYDRILDILEKRKGIGLLLDVGTGCGHFIVRARQKGWRAKGIEPSSDAIHVAAGEGLDIFYGTLQEYRGNDRFNVITLINVLDHCAAPWHEIWRARELLKSGGIIFIRIPNGFLHYHIFRTESLCGLGKGIQRYLIFHHYSLTPRFVEKLLKDAGFSKISIFNSRPSAGDPHRLFFSPVIAQSVKSMIYYFSKLVQAVSFNSILLGTSLDVIAYKDNASGASR
ncbi:MAG: class I SAM-dependent methyltransferase [Desulfobacterales bacterium]|nr:class I SAM-dependent methyltransferase [Desulfobacterales bacterium]